MKIAVYARKSVESDKGDSIRNQINKCQDYIKITKGNEDLEFFVYKDEGYTGANTFRPDFQRLVRDIEQGKIDILVCYRLDRITRSTADFSDINKKLQKHNVNFVSVNESFDTSTPMGRAMLQIIIVFAELERETISERITDNMFELAKTERWIGGKAPLGYKLHRYEIEGTKKKQTRLEIDEQTVDIIKLIFNKYLELSSMSQLESFLLQNRIASQNGKNMTTSQIAIILKNPSYVKADERVKAFYIKQGAQFHGEVNGETGLMTYGKTKSLITDKGKQGLTKKKSEEWIISVGTHHGIIETDIWLEAQTIMQENKDKFPRTEKSHTALVSSIIRCVECGSIMSVNYGRKTPTGEKGYYYACKMRKKSKGVRCSNGNARADLVDQAVINELKKLGINKELFLRDLRETLKHNKKEVKLNPTEFIKVDIEKKGKQIERLVKRISNTDDDAIAIDYENQIKELKKAIISLSAELSSIGERKTTVRETEDSIAFVEKLLDKCGHIDNMELEEQRELVKALFERITWNAETESLSFVFISDSDGGGDDNGDDDNEEENDGDGGDLDDKYASLEAVIAGDEVSHFNQSLSRSVGRCLYEAVSQRQHFGGREKGF